MGDEADDAIDRILDDLDAWDAGKYDEPPEDNYPMFHPWWGDRAVRNPTKTAGKFHPWKTQPRTLQALKDAIDATRQKGHIMPPIKRKPPTAQGNASAGHPRPTPKRLPPARKPGVGGGKTLDELEQDTKALTAKAEDTWRKLKAGGMGLTKTAKGSGCPLGLSAFPVGIEGHKPGDALTSLVIGAVFDVLKPGAKAFPSIGLTTVDGAEIRAASNGRFVYWWVGGVLYALRLEDVTKAVIKQHGREKHQG